MTGPTNAAARSRPALLRTVPVERGLLSLVFGRSEDVSEFTVGLASIALSNLLVDTAVAWALAPVLQVRLRAIPGLLPGEAAVRLAAATRVARVRTMELTARGSEVIAGLLDAGIPAAAFKGLALVARPGVGSFRSMGDVDLLVAEDRLEDALACLAVCGFRPEVRGSLDDYRAFIRNAPHFSGNLAVPLVDDAGRALDLHWGFGPMCGSALQPDRVLERSVEREYFGRRIRCVSRTDGLLLAAHHAMRENFTPSLTARNLLDIDLLGRDDGDESIRPEILAAAGSPATALAACASLLDALGGREDRRALRESLAEALDPAALDQARDFSAIFEQQIDGPALNRDLLHVLHGTTLGKLILTALWKPRRNRRFMADLQGVPTRARLWRFLADLRRTSVRNLRLYRSLARAKRACAERE